MEQVDVKQRTVAIARDLHALAVSSYGPTGRVKVLQPNEDALDAVEVTTVAEQILSRLGASECPVANVYLHILKSKLRNHGDGGLFTLLLSSKLQLAALDGTLDNVPRQTIVQGFHLALEWCIAYLEDPSCPVRISIDWSNTIAVFAVLRGVIGSKSVATTGASAQDQLSDLLPLLVETFVSVLPFVTEHPGESLPIRFFHDTAYASSLGLSRVLKNAVLLNLNRHASFSAKLLPLTNTRVLLFSISLDPTQRLCADDDTSNGIAMSSNVLDTEAVSQEEEVLRQLAEDIALTGARVVLSQKLIPDFLQDCLAQNGILAVERLGITHTRAAQLLTGATALGDWRTITNRGFVSSAMGFLTAVRVAEINHEKMVLLENDDVTRSTSAARSWPVATLVLSVHNEQAYTELVHVITSGFKRLEALMETPDVVAGAGCTEIHLAAWIRRNADHLVVDQRESTFGDKAPSGRTTLRQLRSVLGAFADALESVVVALDHGVHGLAEEVTHMMRQANAKSLLELPESQSYTLFGWDPIVGQPCEVATIEQPQQRRMISDDRSSGSESTSDEEENGDESNDHSDDEEDEDKRVLTAARVLDSLAVKRDALATAVECATTLLQVGGVVIHTSP